MGNHDHDHDHDYDDDDDDGDDDEEVHSMKTEGSQEKKHHELHHLRNESHRHHKTERSKVLEENKGRKKARRGQPGSTQNRMLLMLGRALDKSWIWRVDGGRVKFP